MESVLTKKQFEVLVFIKTNNNNKRLIFIF